MMKYAKFCQKPNIGFLFMISLKLILLLFLVLLVIQHTYRFVWECKSLVYCKSHNNEDDIKTVEDKIIALIPVLKEKDTICQTIDYLKKFQCDYLDIVIITTEKEKLATVKDETTTLDVVHSLNEINGGFHVIHYPKTEGFKGDQINFAVDECKKIFPYYHWDNCFFVIFDADSRPSNDFFDVFCKFNRKQKGNVYQAYTLYYQNISALNNFLLLNAIHQTRFTFAYEVTNQIRQSNYFHHPTLFSSICKFMYTNCVGHGLFIRCSFLDQNRFPDNYPVEDLLYSFYLNCTNEPIYPLIAYDNCEVPNAFSKWMKQSARWFMGLFETAIHLRIIRQQFVDRKTQNRALQVSVGNAIRVHKWLGKSMCCFCVYTGTLTSFINLLYRTFDVVDVTFVMMGLLLYVIQILSLWVVRPSQFMHSKSISTFRWIVLFMLVPFFMIIYSTPTYYSVMNYFGDKNKNCEKTDKSATK